MKNEPEFQGQHRLSQIYLKQFGYMKDNKWWVSVYQAGKETTDNILVEQFTKETNIFDLPYRHFRFKRHFENTSNKIENHYKTIISNLDNQKQLTPKDNDILCHFVPNLMCRTNPFRSFIDSLLRTAETRDKFLNEITLLMGDNVEIKNQLSSLKIDFQLNIAIGTLMNHMIRVLTTFKQVVIKNFGNNGWITTDNPVYLDRQEHYEWIIPIEAEIYFPLSKDYCLFMYHDKSEINKNPLRNLKPNKIHSVDFATFESITEGIVNNHSEYLIMPTELEITNVTDNEKNGL